MSAKVETASSAPLTERYEALLRVSQTLISNRSLEELLSVLARELREVVHFHYLGVGIYDEKAHEVCLKMFGESGTPLQVPTIAPEESVTWWVYQHQQPLIISSSEADARFPVVTELLKNLGIRSICTLPLTTVHRRLGGLAVSSIKEHSYSKEEVSFLSLVANQVALAVDDALNFEASRLAQERLRLLLDLTNRVITKLDLRELLREICASIRHVMHCECVGVVLPDPETGQLRLYAYDFPRRGIAHEGMVISADGAATLVKAFRTGQPVGVAEVESTADPQAFAEGLKSMSHLPLISRERVLGVLSLGSTGENAFAQDDAAFLGQVANQIALAVENALAYGQIADLKDKLAQEKLYLEEEIRTEYNFQEIVGKSRALKRALHLVETVAQTGSTVLIYGETGTGKELIARAIHDLSSRRERTFVKVNCAAIPTGLLESEMFGHEKGAFTGAIERRVGRFELADKGTIFLDEVGDVPLELQPKLLRVLQEQEFERLGSSRTMRVDTRVVAATNCDLAQMVAEKKFRGDLYYRLNVFPIRVPPLRERPEDIPLLVRTFVAKFAKQMKKPMESLPAKVMSALTSYPWPGNIRELQNVIERAMILSRGSHLEIPLSELQISSEAATTHPDGASLMAIEREHILSVLRESNWMIGGATGAAARLGLPRTTLNNKMRKLGIERPRA